MGIQAGGRLQLGAWLNPCGTVAIEGEYMAPAARPSILAIGPRATPILAGPFYHVDHQSTVRGTSGVSGRNRGKRQRRRENFLCRRRSHPKQHA